MDALIIENLEKAFMKSAYLCRINISHTIIRRIRHRLLSKVAGG
jgi:hypothetical protein